MKIKAYGIVSHIPMSLSNYMVGCVDGTVAARKAFKDVVNDQPFDAGAICRALNSHPWTRHSFEPYEVKDGELKLLATDSLGNQDIIRISNE